MSVSAQNPDVVFVGTAPNVTRAHIYASFDGGDSWSDVTTTLPDRYPMDIAIDPNDENTTYVVFGGYGSGHVYKTINGGESWSDITGTLPDVPTLAVTIDPFNSNYVYIGSDLGVFASEDGGTTWNDFNNGLPEAVMGMDLNISRANRSLWIATHGNGAYRRELIYVPEFYLTVNMIGLPSSIIMGEELSFEASVRNIGNNAQSEDYEIEARLIDPNGTTVYSDTQTFCCLEQNESTIITFADTYIPEVSGKHVFELIKYGNSQLPGDDTLSQAITVAEPASILLADVQKVIKSYSLIVGGTSFSGDDAQRIVSLPFEFGFDDHEYDQVQISTNGWLEFGTGVLGSERGISNPEQIGSIGANENGRMAGTAHPTKALGPWWEDLNADENRRVRYLTLGDFPSRIFVCQWEHMRAYWNPDATTTRVNFQVRLYEDNNKIEYCYGDVESGTFGGEDVGASIGFKDHIGGDYRFFDIITGKPIPAGEVNTYLRPLKNWPGKNTVYQISTIATDVDEPIEYQPENYALYQNYPNPFNPSTTIKYTIPNVASSFSSSNVTLKVYDVLGREVETLVNKKQKPGNYEVVFNAANLTSGVYFYSIRAEEFNSVKKMILLK